MATTTPSASQRALSSAELALIDQSKPQLPGWKTQLWATATLQAGEVNATGALMLLRGASGIINDFALTLLDDARGETVWFQELSAKSSIECTDSRARQYLLTGGNEPAELTFCDENEADRLRRNVQKACRRLGKRVNGEPRKQTIAEGDLCSSPEEIRSHLPAETPVVKRKQVVSSAPNARKWPSQSTSDGIIDERRRKTAPPVLGVSYRDDDDGFEFNGTRNDRLKVEGWLEHMSISSDRPLESLSISSAPPRILVLPPGEELSGKQNEKPVPFSCPVLPSATSSTSLLLPESIPIIRSPSQNAGSRTWKATISGKEYEIPDVTRDITVPESKKANEGGFGVIRRGRLHGQEVALKQMKPSRDHVFSRKIKMSGSKRFQKEVVLAMLCDSMRHKNIVQFKGVAISESLGACLVFPWMENGNSLEYVNAHKDVRREPIIRGVLEGLAYLHEQGVIHADIKAQNVLISDEGVALISDFGLATHVELDDEQPSRSIQQAGNIRWMAPEIDPESPGSGRTKMSDMWAFGMFAIEILTGEVPFPRGSHSTIRLAIYNEDLPSRPTNSECSETLWTLIKGCWNKDPKNRVTAKRALYRLDKMESGRWSI